MGEVGFGKGELVLYDLTKTVASWMIKWQIILNNLMVCCRLLLVQF